MRRFMVCLVKMLTLTELQLAVLIFIAYAGGLGIGVLIDRLAD